MRARFKGTAVFEQALSLPLRYAVAVASVAFALALKTLLDPLSAQDAPFLLAFGAVMVSAWYGGLGPGLLATVLAGLGVDYFFLDPRGSFSGLGPEAAPLAVFFLEGTLLSSVIGALRAARRRAEEGAREALSHQESLRESEERFRLLVEGVGDYAIFMLDPEGRVTTWNEGAERINGYGAPEILGRHFSVFYTEEDFERDHPQEELRIAAAENCYEEEGIRVRKDGSKFWASVLITALRDEEGNLRGFSKVVRDITERKRAEEALRKVETRYRTLIEQIPAVTYIEAAGRGERSTHLLYISPQIEDMLGYSPEEWMADPELFVRLLHPDDRERVVAEDARTDETGEPFAMEYRQITRSGRVVWIRDEAVLVHGGESEPLYWLGVQSDITEQKEAEQSLREREELFRATFEQAAVGMAHVSVLTRWLKANDRLCRMLGYTEEEMLRLGFQEVTHPDDLDVDFDRFGRTLAGELHTYSAEKRYVRKDGGLIWVNQTLSAVHEASGRLVHFLCIVEDITERKRSEEKLRRSLDSLLALYEAGQVFGSTLDREQIGSKLLEITQRVSSLSAACIELRDEDRRSCTRRSVGPDDLWRRLRAAPEAQAARRAALEGGRPRSFGLGPPGADGASLVGLCLPLRVRDRIVGLLEAYGSEDLADRENVETLASLANQGASALENARLYEELAERERDLEDLVGRILLAQEEERRRVAYEVHDGLTQVVIAVHQRLQIFAEDHPPGSAEGRKELEEITGLVRRAVGEARGVIADLRPTTLDDFGLATAVRLKVGELREAGHDAVFEETLGEGRLPAKLETALFRVAQEALTNARKHSGAGRVRVSLGRDEDGTVRLEVRDWGRGFEPAEAGKGGGLGEKVGLSSMRERVALLGGDLAIESEPGQGTSVVAWIPPPVGGRVGGPIGGPIGGYGEKGRKEGEAIGGV